jgi:protein involved in polysaccharide export with SLBB domain
LPRLGRIRADAMTAASLQDSLYTSFGRYLRNPSIQISVLRRIGVHGEVRSPDLYMVDLTMTLREVIASAGGITDAGNPEKITIIRAGEEVRLDGAGQAQFVTAELRSGDQIVVGRRSWISMNPMAAISTSTAVISFLVGVVLPLVR